MTPKSMGNPQLPGYTGRHFQNLDGRQAGLPTTYFAPPCTASVFPQILYMIGCMLYIISCIFLIKSLCLGGSLRLWSTLPQPPLMHVTVAASVENRHTLLTELTSGAGTGKTNIVRQLSKYQCPIIDCGYYFEVWNDESLKFNRIGCVTDDEC